MSADISPRAWFVSLEFHDDNFSKDSIVINVDHIPGCDLLLGSIARVAPFHASKPTRTGRNSADHASNVDDSSQYGGTTTSDGTESQASRRTVSRGTRRTTRSNRGVDGDVPGTVEYSKSLVFRVGQLTSEQRMKKPHMQVSLHSSVKSIFNFTNRQRAVVFPQTKEDSQASFIELAFRDQYLSRSDMWQLTVNELSNQSVYRGQQVLFMGSIKAKVKNIFVRGRKVNSALVTASTVPIFRSESARYVFFVQMSREMWEYDADGSGEIMFNKVINGFLPDLFKRWQRAAARHLVSIILFSRIEYERGILKHSSDPAYNKRSDPDDKEQKDYRDYYRVVTTDVASGEWIRILYALKKEFKVFLRDTLIMPGDEAYGRLPDSLSEVKGAADVECVIAGRPTIAAKGNVLEAINLASSQFAQDYIDRDLVRTGISLVIITAGSGVFEVDYDILKLTTDTLVGNGFGIDLVALSPMPLHSVPLFRYHTPTEAQHILAKCSYGSFARGSATPRNMSLRYKLSASPVKMENLRAGEEEPGIDGNRRDGSIADSAWSFALPHWIDVSFWTGDADSSWEDTNAVSRQRQTKISKGFTSSIRMYELQMMGLMDIEIADICLPLLSTDINPVGKGSQDSKTSTNHSTDMSRLLTSSNAAAWTPRGSPEKQTPEPEPNEDPTRKLLTQWMDDYDKDAFQHEESACLALSFKKTQKGVDQARNHTRSDSISTNVVNLGTSPSGSILSRSPLSQFQGLKKPRDRKESMASIVSVPDSVASNDNGLMGSKMIPDGRPDLAKRAKLNRQISLGFKGLGPGKATASTSISSGSVDMAPASSDMRSGGNAKTVGLLTQQLRNSLRKKPSEAVLEGHDVLKDARSQKQHQSNPISIQKDSSSDSSNDDDSLADATVKPGALLKPSEYGSTVRPDNKFLKAAPGRKDSIAKIRDHGLSPLSAMSPWLTLLNPSNPRKDNMSVASQFRRWQHVFPRAIPTTVIKWKSLTSPAALPLTSEYFPTHEELTEQYNERSHRVRVPEDEDNDLKATDTKQLMRRLVASRLSNGFQLVVGDDAKAHAEVLDLKLIECFDPGLAVDQESVVLMSIGNDYHQLQCLPEDEILVKRYIRKPTALPSPLQDSRISYKPRVRTMLAETYTKRTFVLQNPRSVYDWVSIDEHSAGVKPELSDEFRFWRARFVLIPAEIPKGPRGTLAPVVEATDEENRLEGIQKLTQLWQRHRYFPPSEKRHQASLPQQHKDTNPLAIDYQTRDPSAVVRAHGMGPLESLLYGSDGFPLFAESEMYHSGDFDLQRLAQHLQSKPPKGVVMVDRRWHWKLYHRCFRGDELTSWILANFKDMESREDAVRLGNDLMKKGLFTHVSSKHHFRDGHYFYQVSSEYRTTSYQDNRGWFSRITDRSIPSTPSVDTNHSSPMSERPASRASRGSSDTSSGERTPTKENVLELSRMLQYDVDPKRKSWRPEIIHLHYDRIHNPDNCYHLRIEWMNVTSKLIEDVIVQWATTVDRYGLKLVEVPIAEACKISEDHPFRTPYKVELALPPPKSPPRHYFETSSFGAQPADEPHAYHKALLRKWDFVLDVESARSFDQNVPVTYSWGKPSYQYTQFIHKSGTLLAQITDEGAFLMLANRLCSNRVAVTKEHGSTSERGPLDRRTTRTTGSPYASPLIRPSDIPIPPSPHLSALSAQRPPGASRATTATAKKDIHRPQSFSESRLNGKPLAAETLLTIFEKYCHNKAELETFWEDALKPSASPSPRQHPADRASPRITPTLRGVSAAFGRGRGPELGAVEEIPSLGLPERRMQLSGARAASYAPGSGFGLGPGAAERERERERDRRESGGEGRSGGLAAQLLGRPTSPRDVLEGMRRASTHNG
ncbi:Vacuolar membrane-associated protein iml1-like protein [Elsinoe fawcettii]|nr:Vacuolar membrane-associated protein iml1-like protein [Elsinoe fawcettii]